MIDIAEMLEIKEKSLFAYCWTGNEIARDAIIGYLTAWHDYSMWFRGVSDKPADRPNAILYLYGDYNVGKSHILQGIMQWFFKYVGIPANEIVWIDFPTYVTDNLNNAWEYFNWRKYKLMILDDIDRGAQPIPKSMDTWLVGSTAAQIKARCSYGLSLPTIVVSNRDPHSKLFIEWFSSTSLNKSTPHTEAAGSQMYSILLRSAFNYTKPIEVQKLPMAKLPTQKEIAYLNKRELVQLIK